MNKPEMLAFINKCGSGFLATADGNKARVRGMETFRADDKGIIMYTSKSKDVFKQASASPEVEVCYFNEGFQLRVSGRLEIVEDEGIKKEIVAAKPFLKPMVDKAGYGALGVLRLAKGKATTWSMETIALPKTYVDF
jgi:pyridoxamine 5'-phosphate oxidase